MLRYCIVKEIAIMYHIVKKVLIAIDVQLKNVTTEKQLTFIAFAENLLKRISHC